MPGWDSLIAEITELVERTCRESPNPFGYGIWSHHIFPMLGLAPRLSDLHHADRQSVQLAVLLHDYAGIMDRSLVEEHHIHGAREARRLLTVANYPDDKLALVENAILSHRGSRPTARQTSEAKCLADCDAIVHFTQLPSLFFYAYRVRELDIDSGAEWIRAKLDRDWEKLSKIGRDYIRRHRDAVYRLLAQNHL